MTTGKRIGFVDYKLENFHANVYLKAFRGPLKDRGWTVAGAWSTDVTDGKAWAAHNDVPWYDSPAALNEHVDAYMILAPSNPELHLGLCQQVFPFAKTTYVDKTFAPDLATAKQIFALADRHKTATQTSSALRYTNVQEHVKSAGGKAAVKHMIAWGGGSSFGEYAIHPVELVISCMGPDATALMRRGTGDYSQLLINFSGGRTGVANVYTRGETPFAAGVTTEKETKILVPELNQIFVDQAAAVLDLFEAGKPNIDRSESLAIRRILDAAEDPAALESFVNL
jgi:predicted dehydrogenase